MLREFQELAPFYTVPAALPYCRAFGATYPNGQHRY